VFNSASGSGSIALVPANPGSSTYTATLPAETGTLCTNASTGTCTTAGAGFIFNQSSTPGTAQTGNFNITGTGTLGGLSAANSAMGTNGTAVGNFTFTNSNTSNSFVGVSGVSVTPTGTANSNPGVNELYAVNLPSVTPVSNNNFTAFRVGTGYNNVL